MKHSFFPKAAVIMMIALSCSHFCNASKLNEKDVPAAVKAAAALKFPGAKISWEKEGKDFEAGFKKDGKSMSAVFDAAGAWKETETGMAAMELPAAVQEYLAKNFKGKKVKEAAVINRADGKTVYEAEIGGKDYLFDEKEIL